MKYKERRKSNMSSKNEILASIKENTLQKFDYPTWKVNAVQYPDLVKQFIAISAAVGGEAVELPEGTDVNDYILKRYPNMNAIASNMPEISCATLNPDEVEVAQDLNGTDLAVVKGEIGVAENGCVWIPQTVKHKIIYFIAERLVIILEKKNLVNNMAEAYAKNKVRATATLTTTNSSLKILPTKDTFCFNFDCFCLRFAMACYLFEALNSVSFSSRVKES